MYIEWSQTIYTHTKLEKCFKKYKVKHLNKNKMQGVKKTI